MQLSVAFNGYYNHSKSRLLLVIELNEKYTMHFISRMRIVSMFKYAVPHCCGFHSLDLHGVATDYRLQFVLQSPIPWLTEPVIMSL